MHLSRYFHVALRYFALGVLLLGAVGKGYGQRIYANLEQHSVKQSLLLLTLSEVQDPQKSIQAPWSDKSTLYATLGALSIIQAWQNLQFNYPDPYKMPLKSSPIYVKIVAADLLTLLKGITIQLSNKGNPTGTIYTDNSLLNLLNLIGNGINELRINANVNYDGVLIKVDPKLLGALVNLELHYAFIIEAPDVNSESICVGNVANLTIDNFVQGNTYNLYDSEIGGNILATTDKNVITTPVINSNTTLFIENVEGDNGNYYYSGRIPIHITVHPKPDTPNVHIITNSQY